VSSLNGKRVLVTGAGGFIASHLAEALVESEAEVRAFVRYRGEGSWGWLDQSTHEVHIEAVAGDVTDRDSVTGAMKSTSIAFHLAAPSSNVGIVSL
jgi:dTDP-glucose 4,6-dehydratase